jgi:hypothetical protein
MKEKKKKKNSLNIYIFIINNMDNWLDTFVEGPYIDHYVSKKSDITIYYNPNDTEIIKQNNEYNQFADDHRTQFYDDLKNRKDKVIAINIPVKTRRYEADIIFRKLIDFHIKSKINDRYKINTDMKNSFYEFIKNNS